jgi:Zinc finger, C3HC4 type (RING finger)
MGGICGKLLVLIVRTFTSKLTSFVTVNKGVHTNYNDNYNHNSIVSQDDLLKVVRRLRTTQRWLCQQQVTRSSTVQSKPERLFLNCYKPTLFGLYRHSGQWFLCRVRSYDCDGSFTICWEDGTLQIGTKQHDLRLPSAKLSDEIENRYDNNHISETNLDSSPSPYTNSDSDILTQSQNDSNTDEELTVWEAAKKGDLIGTLTIIDRGDATPNDVEILDNDEKAKGRTPLYWACFVGHVELVRELLSRGGIDHDGTAYLAVSSRERANDDRDLMFNPDDNIYSDFIDYVENDSKQHSAGQRDNTALIRSMLLSAKMNSTTGIPKRLYESADVQNIESTGLCIICFESAADAVPSPCGHIACCVPCLTSIHNSREGCPICRSRIIAIVQR